MKKEDLVDLAVQSITTLDILMRYLKTQGLQHVITDAVMADIKANLPEPVYEKLLEVFIEESKTKKAT